MSELELVPPIDVEPGDVDQWVDSSGGWFEQAYRYMRSTTGLRPGPCFVCAWMSVSKDDRAPLDTWTALADWLGFARQTLYAWRSRYKLDEWAEQLRMVRMRGDRLGQVDERTYKEAVSEEGSVAARRLYYERAGVLDNHVTVEDRRKQDRLSDWLEELREAGEE